MNRLYYGDNLHVLRDQIAAESVDLIYLDPPFNSKRDYNLLFKSPKAPAGGEAAYSAAQIEAFEDTWHWTQDVTEMEYDQVIRGPNSDVSEMMKALVKFLGRNDMTAYLVMMANRLLQLHRVLKPTGSLYLHCDPTASHYLKIVLDAVFGKENYKAEIAWKRHNARSTDKNWPHVHDTIFFYTKSGAFTFNPTRVKADQAKMPHTLITGPDGKKYQTYELTGAGLTKEGETGKPWHGFDLTAMGRHWGNNHAQMDEWDAQGLIHWPSDGGVSTA